MAARPAYDAVIVGGGHNGLVCACYLAGAGLKVRLLERRDVVGGAAVTEEFHPGFRNSVASYTVSLLQPKIIRDLNLHEHGLRVLERPMSNFLPLDDGRYFKFMGERTATQAEIARFSNRDADRLPALEDMLDGIAEVLRDLVLETPPNAGGGLIDMIRGLKVGNRLRHLSEAQRRDLLDLFTKSAGDLLDSWFESEPIKAAFGFDAVVGSFQSPYAPGSAYVMLHHAFGEVNGKKGKWGHAVGGMGAITQAMAREAERRSVEISLSSPVREVVVDGKAATGVVLEDGTRIDARVIVANLHPKLLYQRLIDPDALDADFRHRIDGYKSRSGTFRMNVALSELPDFSCLPGTQAAEHHMSGIVIAPSLKYMDKAFQDAWNDGWSSQPIVEILIPSTMDDSLAPEGAHVASLFCQHFNPDLPDGRSWDDVRDHVANLIIDTVDRYAPNFKRSVIGRMALSPMDLERKFGLVGGDIFHGTLTLDQLYSARPVLGHGNYRGPLKHLYMCGSGTHPGGGVSGAPGHNAAREILRDLRPGSVRRMA